MRATRRMTWSVPFSQRSCGSDTKTPTGQTLGEGVTGEAAGLTTGFGFDSDFGTKTGFGCSFCGEEMGDGLFDFAESFASRLARI